MGTEHFQNVIKPIAKHETVWISIYTIQTNKQILDYF